MFEIKNISIERPFMYILKFIFEGIIILYYVVLKTRFERHILVIYETLKCV